MSNLMVAAINYAARGWPVFPCGEAGKHPLTDHGLKDASTDLERVRSWWQRWPQANVGVPTGPASGFVVVDLDGPQGQATFEALQAQHGLAPETVSSETGNGRHLLFRCPDPPIGNTQGAVGKGLGAGVDTRGDGGYIIVPPSIHPSGALYQWVDAGPDEPAELPDWLNPDLVHGERQKAKPRNPAPAVTRERSNAVERASLYLATMQPAIQGAGGHSALYAAATCAVHGFDLSDAQALDLLVSEYNPRCVPPWDLANPREARDFRRKISQARSQPHDQPRGWLLNQQVDGAGDVEHGRALAAKLLAPPKAIPAPKPSVSELPAGLLKPGGLVGRLCEWINVTAYMPQPELALGNALAFVGALVGRKVCTPSDLRTNLYCLGVADASSGKDHSRKKIKQLCEAAGLTSDLLGGEEIGSDAGLLSAVKDRPSSLFQVDEIGHLLTAVNARNAQAYMRQIPAVMTKLFSSASTTFIGRETAGKDRHDIEQPNACVYGTTVPSKLYSGITPDDIRDGFLSRMVVFQASNPDPDPRDDIARRPVPADLVATVQAWAQWTPEPPEGVGNIDALRKPWPAAAKVGADAEQVFRAFRDRTRKYKAKVRDHRGLDSLWGRATEHALKIALVVACDEPGRPVIGDDIARYAVDLTERLVRGLIEAVQDHVSESNFGQDQLRVMRAIKTLGQANKTELTKKTQGMTPRQRNEVLAELVETGQVVAAANKPDGRGRPSVVYSMAQETAA